MSDAILIITEKFDPHTDRVIGLLKERGVDFFRLNTDDFHDEITVSASSRDGAMRFADRWGRSHVYPDATRAVWHRKPIDPKPPTALTDKAARGVTLQETLELLSYPSCIVASRWINNPLANSKAQRKFPQLRLAQEFGLRVPRTLVTNDPDAARAFQRDIDGTLTCKSMKAHGFEENEVASFIFSRKVDGAEFERTVGKVAHCPTLLQEYVEKDHELRVTIFGDKVFCCRIDSQAVAGADTDWRKVDPFKVPHRIVELDATVAAALKKMMAVHDLSYGAFDLIVTPKGEIVFLELNPNGQWLWIEMITGAPMAQAMVELLAG